MEHINEGKQGKKNIKFFKFNEKAYCINFLGCAILIYDKKYNIGGN